MLIKIHFISGHLDLTQEEFNQHYAPQIDKVLAEPGFNAFVVGDARGADTMAQEYLAKNRSTAYNHTTVFHMFDKPRNCADADFATKSGYQTDEERDNAMTIESHYDIAWVRPGREKSGTAKNIERRRALVAKEMNDRVVG